MSEYILLDILAAYLLDLIFGDPCWMPHPIRFIGWLIKNTESVLRKAICSKRKANSTLIPIKERIAGILLTVFVVLITFFIVYFVLMTAKHINSILFHIVNIYFLYSAFATKCLADEAGKVYNTLIKGNLQKARQSLAMLVGRETDNLDEKQIIKGVVETTAENTVDGVVSPVIYAFIGAFMGISAPFTYAFKAVSTLDSMVGYKNDKYLNLGFASAKTDDVLNFLPARITGFILPLSALICKMDFRKSFLIMLRDRKNHKSPNCAYPEAAVAGALGVQLGGSNVYFGKIVEKPTIGDNNREIEKEDIKKTIKLLYITSLYIMTILCLFSIIYFKLWKL